LTFYKLGGPSGIERVKAIATLQQTCIIEDYFLGEEKAVFSKVDHQQLLRDIEIVARRIESLPEGSWAEDWCEFQVKCVSP